MLFVISFFVCVSKFACRSIEENYLKKDVCIEEIHLKSLDPEAV